MDLATIKTAFEIVNQGFAILKSVKDKIPSNSKEEYDQKIKESEDKFKLAEATMAKGFEYHICKCEWPPQISTRIGYSEDGYDEIFKCPKCGDIWPKEMPKLQDLPY